MNAYMNIQIRVLSQQAARQLAAVRGEVTALETTTARANGVTSKLGFAGLVKSGSQLQWVGRQLTYNFTIPILAAAAAATKFELDNEKAFTQVVKVYGDGSKTFNRLSQTELPALRNAFVQLSNFYGVAQKDVDEIAASWAAAGASGLALAKSVELTLATMVLGELDAADATQALIAIQAQYGQQIGDMGAIIRDGAKGMAEQAKQGQTLTDTISILNMVENQTGITMGGLVDGMARAAGVARSAGIDVRHLAAMLAAMVPAAGSASNAGNALRTIISRLLSPTKEATDILNLLHIQTDKVAWSSLNGAQRLEVLAQKFTHLSNSSDKTVSAQAAVVSSVVASRWQINRFDVLMRDIVNTNGYYQKALNATSDATANYKQVQKELNTVLDSSPQRLKQIWVILQNTAADVIQPMLPLIIGLAEQIARMAQAFDNLNPYVQQTIMYFLLFIAVVGPFARYLGATKDLIGELGLAFLWLMKPVGALLGGFARLVAFSFAGLTSGIGAVAGGFIKAVLGMLRVVALFFLSPSALIGKFVAAWRGVLFIAVWVGRGLLAALTGPWGIAIAVILGLVYAFRNQIAKAWHAIVGLFSGSSLPSALRPIADLFHSIIQGIINGFNALPSGIRSALLAVIHMVEAAAMAVYHALQYMNPFAHHSPSLVEQTQKGMGAVSDHHKQAAATAQQATQQQANSMGAVHQATAAVSGGHKDAGYTKATLASIQKYNDLMKQAKRGTDDETVSEGAHGRALKSAKNDLDAFNKAMEHYSSLAYQFHDQRIAIAKVQPGALASFDKLIKDLKQLKTLETQQQAAVDKQQQVVDKWAKNLDKANAALDREQGKLDKLQKHLDDLNASLEAHQEALQNFANTPIKGEKAMSDAIFDNEIAQKKLRLEMLKMQDVVGPLDKLQQKLANLQGEIEKLSGEEASLRQSGAGSEILKTYDDQINALKQQQGAIQAQAKPLQDMQDELDALANKGEELQLLNDITFDPLHRQIDDLVNSVQEMSFDDIVAGINKEKDAITALIPQIAAAQAAVDNQQAVVDAAQAAKDAIQDRYDAENAALQVLQDNLNATKDMVNAVTNALNNMGSEAEKTLQKQKAKKSSKSLSPGAQNFKDAAGGGFPDVGGSAKIGREGGLGDQSGLIDSMTEDIRKSLGGMFQSFNPFGPLKTWWGKTVDWFDKNAKPAFSKAWDGIEQVFKGKNPFEGMEAPDQLKNIGTGLVKGWQQLIKQVRDIVHMIMALWRLIEPDVKRVFGAIRDAAVRAFQKIGPQIAKFGELIGPLVEAIGHLWNVLKPVVEILAGPLILALKLAFSILGHTIGPVFNFIIDSITNALKVVRGFIEIILGLINGDWKMMWQGAVDIFNGTFGQIWNIIASVVKVILGVIEGLVGGIVGFFKWLWDELVGHSIIPDMIDAIIAAFNVLLVLPQWIWDNILKPAYDFFVKLWTDTKADLDMWWSRIQTAWAALLGFGKWVWDNILKPAKDFFTGLWPDHVKPALDKWWDHITNAWDALTGLGKWVWDNVLKPAKDFFTGLWPDHVGPALSKFWDHITTDAWGGLTALGGWIWDNVLKPVKDAFTGFWKDHIKGPVDAVMNGIQKAFDSIGGFIKAGINLGIDAINLLIDGLNAVAKILPGVDWSISHIQKLAEGGTTAPTAYAPGQKRMASGGSVPPFITNGARAIVGEGNPAYPEYVIPTDPKFHGRALALLFSAHHDIMGRTATFAKRGGMGGTPDGLPAYGLGGVLGAIGSAAKDFAGWGKDKVRQGAAMAAFGPLHKAAEAIIGKIPWKVPRDVLANLADSLYQWVKTGDSGLPKDLPGDKKGKAPKTPTKSQLKALGGTIPALANGGYIHRRTGGVLVRLGEGKYDEAVTPLPNGARDLRDGGREIHFHGDLSFPNITSPDDAEAFISNLESLAS